MKRTTFILLFLSAHAFSMEFSHQDLLAKMTLEQKIAQLFMVAVVPDEQANQEFMVTSPYRMNHTYIENLIEEYQVGGIIFLGKGTKNQVRDCIDRFLGIAKTPLLFGIDAEWGLNMRLIDADRLPHAMTLGALNPKNNHYIKQVAQLVGDECKELGIGINFAPVADVNTNPQNPIIGIRSFGENAQRVAAKATIFALGLQDAGILACAKHFPGHGDTAVDSHHELPMILQNNDQLEKSLLPFRMVTKSQIGAIMMGHLLIPTLDPDRPASLSPLIIKRMLQDNVRFQGLIITDGLGMKALDNFGKPGAREMEALLAGNDILLGVLDVPKSIDFIKQAIRNKKITEQEIEQRVLKVLQAKDWVHHTRSPIARLNTITVLKKEIFEHAITLIKNKEHLLPLPEASFVHGETHGTPLSAKLFDQLKHYARFDEEASTIILAIYPTAHSHMLEERSKKKEVNFFEHYIDRLHAQGKKVVAVLFDTPYRISEIREAEAIICAYENDHEAESAAALTIMGYIKPEGQLPVTVAEFPEGTSLSFSMRSHAHGPANE